MLHGALCALPLGGRDELRGALCQTQTLLAPLLLLQEQLRASLPDASKVKLLSQNAYYVKGTLNILKIFIDFQLLSLQNFDILFRHSNWEEK